MFEVVTPYEDVFSMPDLFSFYLKSIFGIVVEPFAMYTPGIMGLIQGFLNLKSWKKL